MTLIQFFIVVFVAFAGSRAILRFHDKAIGYGGFILWSAIWTAILLITFRPNLSDQIALYLGIKRGTDVMFFSAIILLFYLIFRLYIKLDALDRNITLLAENTSKSLHRTEKK